LLKENTEKDFETKIRENELIIYKICRLYAHTAADRDDLYQEIVYQLWRSYQRFRGESLFSTWLYRVAFNTAIASLRKQSQVVANIDEQPVSSIPDTTGSEEEQLKELYKAISRLNEIERAIVMLYLDDRSYEEMEAIMGISSGTLRVRMSRIKDKLRDLTKTNA
jgi:RNA polymerase sigma-70 factor (ECF subfamily)